MRKIVSIAAALMLLVTLATLATSCTIPSGGGGGGGDLIGVAMPTKSLQRWNQDGDNMKKQLEAAGYRVDLQYAADSVETQVSQIENMITKGAKVLVIASIDGESLGGVLEDAAKDGIKVIAYDRLIRGTEHVDYYATFDNYKVGALQGQYIVETLGLDKGEKGPFTLEVFGGSPDDNNAYFFNAGAMDTLQPYIDSGALVIKSGQVDMEQIAISGWKSEGSQARMDNLLTAFYSDENIDVVLSPNDSLAAGIVASLKAAGY
ncbi:MAG: sugar ABC transporter substrate-binding protein, partial [Bacillota bacterium]|nr:sugar ABC transporter substrate-binding protein [Bacillota bacterium]